MNCAADCTRSNGTLSARAMSWYFLRPSSPRYWRLQLAGLAQAIKLDEQALAQVARRHSHGIEALDERQGFLRDVVLHPRRLRHLDQRHLQEPGVVQVADDLLARAHRLLAGGREGQLPHQVIGQVGRLDLRIEEELAPLGRLGIVGRGGGGTLRKILAPLLVLLAQLLEFLVELVVVGRLGLDLLGALLQHGIDLDLLLDERLQLHRRRLQELQRLLHLRGKRLPERERLMKSDTGHSAYLTHEAAQRKHPSCHFTKCN
jgi:hypothetical protein